MLAPKYIETNPTVLRDQKTRLDNHQQKLKYIKTRHRPADLTVSSERHISPGRSYRAIDTGDCYSDRLYDINLENKVLFEKLISIKEGKWRSFQNTPRWEPRSLNITTRQRELERIAEANSQMARRLVSKRTHLSHKQFNLDYHLACKYRRQISKAAIHPKGQKASTSVKLPPLQDAV